MSNSISEDFQKWKKEREEAPDYPNDQDLEMIDQYVHKLEPKSEWRRTKWQIWEKIIHKLSAKLTTK